MSGKRGTAPCGHEGEHITTNYVRCGQGCDSAGAGDVSNGVPTHVEPERTVPICPFHDCFDVTAEIVKWGSEYDENGQALWLCRGCGRSFYA